MEQVLADGRYEIRGVLGSGGFGTVYRAYDRQLKAMCAVKKYTFSGSGEKEEEKEGRLEQFRREASILKGLTGYPGVVRYGSYFEENQGAYYTMELLEGDTLGHRTKQRKFGFREITDLIRKTAEYADACHERAGILHRDLTPENIFLTDSGEIKMIDFGSAVYLSDSKDRIPKEAKPEYAPLEQIYNGEQGRFTDVYSLAASYYYLLTGRRIPPAVERKKGEGYAPLFRLCPEAEGRISDAVDNALKLYPEERTQTMADFAGGLRFGEKSRRKILYFQRTFQGIKSRPIEFWGDCQISIGRGEENDLVLRDPERDVSRRHCRVSYDERADKLKICDTSLNGTFVNNRRIAKGREILVALPAKIYLANRKFEFVVGVRE